MRGTSTQSYGGRGGVHYRHYGRMYTPNTPNFQRAKRVNRGDPLTYEGDAPEIYGGTSYPLFDRDADNALMALSFAGQYSPLMDWIGWRPSRVNKINRAFLTYAAGAGAAAGTPNSSRVSDPCAPGAPVEWGRCDFTIRGFGRLRRRTPVRSDDEDGLVYSQKYIDTYRLDGTPITDEKEFDLKVVTSVLIDDFQREVIVGSKAAAGSFDGLLALIDYGYTDSEGEDCSAMDSTVIDWAGQPMIGAESDDSDPETTITINGQAIADGDTYGIYNFLRSAVIEVRSRIASAPMTGGQLTEDDVALVMPTSWIPGFLDSVVCFQLCGGNINRLDTMAAREYRNGLNGGRYGFGTFEVDGLRVQIIGHDHGMITDDGLAEILFLVRGVGSQPFIEGQYKDNEPTVQKNPGKYGTLDRNMLLTWRTDDETCSRRSVQIQPRLLLYAPWAQIRFTNVGYSGLFAIKSNDPVSDYFRSNKVAAVRLPAA